MHFLVGNNGATEAMTILNSGNVGISNSAPQSLLDIQGPAGTGAASAGILTLSTKETTIVDDDQLGRINFNAPLEADGSDAILPGAAIWAEAEATFSATVNTTGLVFGTGTTSAPIERMRINGAGNVGIGTAAPNYPLDIQGELHIRSTGADDGAYFQSVTASNMAFAGGARYNGSAWVAKSTEATIVAAVSGTMTIYTDSSLTAGNTFTPTSRLAINSAGEVGIATASASGYKLSVGGEITTSGRITSTAGNNQYVIYANAATTGYTVINLENTGGSTFFGMENSSGNNLIAGDSAYDTIFRAPSGVSFSANAGANLHGRIASTGAWRMPFYGSGAATFDASGNITSVSDERFKNIQGNFTAGLKEILQIQPITYKYNELSQLEMENTYAGFSAQNVMKYIPEAVGKNSEGYYSFTERPIVAALVNAVKALKEEIDELRSHSKLPTKEYEVEPLLNEERLVVSKPVVSNNI